MSNKTQAALSGSAKKIQLFIICLLFLAAGFTHAGDKIKLKLHQPPPNKLGAGSLWKLDITNTTNENITVYLEGTATEEKDGLIVQGKSGTITVKPGKSTYGYNDFKGGEVNWKNKTYEEAILRTGNVKSGSYTICVTAYFENGSVADIEQCITQVIENTSAGVIALIAPGDGENIDPGTLPGISFAWTGTGLKGPYTLRIVELKGSQSQEQAMKENRPVLDKKGITITSYQYSAADPRLEKGKNFVWMVKAGETESDIYSFFVSPQGDSINLVITPIPCQGCCFNITISGNFTTPWNSFKLTSGSNNITSVTPASGMSIVSQTPGDVVIKKNSGWFSTGSNIAVLCFNQVSAPFPVFVMWSTNGGSAFVMPADQQSIQCPPPCTGQNDTCIDFENSTNTGNWTPYFIQSIVINNFPSDLVNNTNVLVLTDDQGGSIAVNNTEFTGNWLNFGQDGCLCFDYKVNWVGPATPVHYPKLGIYTGAPIPNSGNPAADVNEYVSNRTRASFVGWPSQPVIQDNVWNHWCLAIGLSSGGNLPSNTYGYWQVTQNGVLLSGAAACTAWDNLIQNVTGFVLHNDYNSDPSEIVSFDNFCWQCTPTGSVPGPCDSLNATASASQGQGNCCWQVSLSHPQNTTGIKGIQFLPLSPNTFASASLGSSYTSGWMYQVNNSTEFKIKRVSGYVPPGQLNGFFNFCLNTLSGPQYIVVNWLNDSNNVICSDTVTVNCDIPCVTYTKDTIECNGSNYNWVYSFTNNSNFPISDITYTVLSPPGAVITPGVTTLTTPVNTSQNSGNITLGLSGVGQNTNVCVVMKFLSADSCCWCYDTLCVTTPSCICDDVDASVTGDPYSCCYNLSLINNYAANYFTQVNLTCITAGVTISTFSFTGNWGSMNVFPSGQAQVIEGSGYIPLGTSANIGNFCFTGYTTAPQYILVEWIRNDSVKCIDTIITNCVPPEPPRDSCAQVINDTVICLPDGTFQYTFQVQNNDLTHTATGFQLNPVSPLGLILTPNNFTVSIPPNTVSPPQTLIVSGVGQNSAFCFELAVYQHVGNTYSWCCHGDTVCLTTPVCGGGQDTCQCENGLLNNWNLSQGIVVGNLAPSGTGQLTSWQSYYGTPQVQPANGCCDPGFIHFWGHQTNGEGFSQTGLIITSGTKYRISVCTRLSPLNPGTETYGRIRVSFSNGVPATYPGGVQAGIIGDVSTATVPAIAPPGITSTVWNTYSFEWTAGANYNTINFNPINNNSGGPSTVSWMQIDNICIQVLPDSCNCGQMKIDTFSVKENNITVFSGGCRDTMTGTVNHTYSIGTPLYTCNGNCTATLQHKIFHNGTLMSSGSGAAVITANPAGLWEARYYFYCGEKLCDSCSFFIRSTDSVPPCKIAKGFDSLQCGPMVPFGSGMVQSYTFNLTVTSGFAGWLQTMTSPYYWYSNSGNIVNPGTNNFNCTYLNTTNLPPGTTVCLAGGVMRQTAPFDTCYFDVCFQIPQCGDSCSLQILGSPNQGDTLCKGDAVTINWTGYCPSGMVNLSLINVNGWVVYQTIASNIPNSGSYNWTIPPGISCDSVTKWQFYIEDSPRHCWNYGPVFYIKCCDTVQQDSCNCGKWKDKSVTVSPKGGKAGKLKCGGTYTTGIPENIAFSFPSYICLGQNCAAAYMWNINGPQGPANGTGNSFAYIFSNPGTYNVTVYSYCGGKLCDSCTVTVNAKGDPEKCECNEKASFIYNPGNGLKTEVKCGETIFAAYQQTLTFSPLNLCIPKECAKGYTYEIHDLQTNAYVTGQSMLTMTPFTVTINSYAGCIITITYNCNGVKCKCVFYIRTKEQGCNCGNWKPAYAGVIINSQPAYKLECGGTINADQNANVTVNFPSFICKPDSCKANYTWNLSGGTGINENGTGNSFNHIFNSPGFYDLSLNAYCGGKLCDSCVVRINIKGSDTCTCNKWNGIAGTLTYPTANGNVMSNINCGGDIQSPVTGNFVFNFNPACLPPGACNADFKVQFQNAVGTVMQEVTGTSPLTVMVNTSLYYRVKLFSYCDGVLCDTCSFTMYVATGHDPGKDRLYGFDPGKNYEPENISQYDKNLFVRMAEIRSAIVRWFRKI